VSVIDDETGRVMRTVRVQARPNRIAVSPDGLVYLTHRRSWNVSVLDGEAGRVLTTIRLAGEPWGIAPHPNGTAVYVATLAGDVNVIDSATNRVRGAITFGGKAYDIAISPNGTKGYVHDLFTGTVSVLDLGREEVVDGISTADLPYIASTGIPPDCVDPPHAPHPTAGSAPGSARRPGSMARGTVVFTSGAAYPGKRQRLEVTLRGDGVPIAGLQVDVRFEPEVAILAGRDGRPLCTVNPTLGKDASAFAFQPPGCTPGEDCMAVRAYVLSVADVNPIPDRPFLFGCTLGIAIDAVPGRYEVGATRAIGSTPDGRALDLRAFPHEVEVLSPGGGRKSVFAGGSDHPSGSLCAGGPQDGSPCENDARCPAGACTWAQGVCDGGDDDGLLCDCHDWWTCRYSICDRADCIPTQRICAAGIAKGLACLRDAHCGGERCVSTGNRCDGGDFDSYACVDHSDCPLGSCSAPRSGSVEPPRPTPAAEPPPTAPQAVRAADEPAAPPARVAAGGCSVGPSPDGGGWLLTGLLALLAKRRSQCPNRRTSSGTAAQRRLRR
jgi:MYXO-CTERM domain-containing protein